MINNLKDKKIDTKHNPAILYPLIGKVATQIGRPICILDTETTGFSSAEVGLVELAYITVHPNGSSNSFEALVNPGMPIPWFATKVHGIKNSDVSTAPGFRALTPMIDDLFIKNVIAGFNSRAYDVPVLQKNYARYNVDFKIPKQQLDVRDIWFKLSKMRSGTLLAVASAYSVTPGYAHRAMGDVLTTTRLLESMVKKHGADFVAMQMT